MRSEISARLETKFWDVRCTADMTIRSGRISYRATNKAVAEKEKPRQIIAKGRIKSLDWMPIARNLPSIATFEPPRFDL